MPPSKPDTRSSGAVHDSTLPQWAVDKMIRRRGRRYAFEKIDPTKTALVVVDLMRNFVENTPCAASIVAPVARLADCLRDAGGVVAWVYPAPISSQNSVLEALWGTYGLQKNVEETADDSISKVLAEGLSPSPQDIVVQKRSYSAFFPGMCALPDVLSGRGVETVIVTGVLTNICCESSARDAATLGYQVIMVADANAARSDEEHQAALYNVLRNFGDVRETDDLIALING